ncbi:MAG: hypothetical protein L6R36_007428 [Xanthoria steineri]|nr:MAG: hypothetical protein L6R36_007428 [Xanthoria steineri]
MAGLRITKLSKKPRATTTTPPSMFSLPLELRNMIYQHYLHDLFPCRDQSVYESIITDKIDHVPLLHVNIQVYVEVQEALKKPNEGLDVELSWQGLRIDPLAVLRMRFRSKGDKWHINALPYLRIKIFAPHPKRPTDIICLWHYARALCDQLRGYPRIPRLIIDFQESTDATEDLSSRSARPSWSKAEAEGLAKKSIEHEQLDFWECDTFPQCFCQNDTYEKDDLEATCDVKYILDVFSLMTTASAVEIHLPPSLATNGKLQTIGQQRIDAMTHRRTPLFDPNAYGQAMALLLASSSTALIHQTGQNSFQQLVRLSQQDGAQIADARGVQEIWPHICCLTRSREEMSRLRWPAHWVKGFTSLTPCYGCEKLSYGVRRSRDFRYAISLPRDRGGEPLEALGGRHRRGNRTARYWQLESLFASD